MLASSSLRLFQTRRPTPPGLVHASNLALCSARIAQDASAVPRTYTPANLPPLHTARFPPAIPASPPAHSPAVRAPPDPRAAKSAPDAVPQDDVHAARRGQPVFDPRPPYHHQPHPTHSHSHPHPHPEAFVHTHSPVPRPHPAVSTLEATLRDDRDEHGRAGSIPSAYLAHSAHTPPSAGPDPAMAGHHLQYPSYQPESQEYVSRAPSVSPAYADPTQDRRVSTSSAGSYEHAYQYGTYHPPRPYHPARATPPVMARPAGGSLTPYEYPLEQTWSGRRPSSEQSPAPSHTPGARYDDFHHPEDLPAQTMGYALPLDHHSPMQSLGSSSSNSTGIPASPDLALPSGLVAASLPEGATAPSAQNPGQRTYAFVSLAGSTIRKRPRRRYDEIERLYSCSYEDCTKAYGTLNHLNAHVTMQKHGLKRNPSEFKELRKLWRSQKKAEQMASRPRRRRGIGQDDDDDLRGLHRTSSGSYDSPGYGTDPESDDGTPQPGESYPGGQMDPMWGQSMGVASASGVPGRYEGEQGMQYGGHPHEHDPHAHAHGMPGHLMGSDEGVMDRIPANATLLQSLPPSHPSQQQQQFSGAMHPMAGYGNMPMSGSAPMMRRPSDYDYHRPGPSGGYGR